MASRKTRRNGYISPAKPGVKSGDPRLEQPWNSAQREFYLMFKGGGAKYGIFGL
jgi:hypothetical protein